ncbi:efflux RND transporter periplasmic adaptor subunit [Myxococcota bacterium]|nr:efflux RND transporter periplasmic adaptor subunit [Myxococcota bacterium]
MNTSVRFSFLLFLLPLALLSSGCSKSQARKDEAAVEFRVSVEQVKITKADLNQDAVFSAVSMPWEQFILSFKAQGRIRKLTFEEGAVVKKNDLLGIISEEDYWLARKMASIQVNTLNPDYERIVKLTEKNAIPGAEKGRMEGRLSAAKTQLLQAETALAGTILRSPADGIIVKKLISIGDLVGPSRPAGVLLDLSHMKIIINVPEDDLKYVKKDMTVNVEFPAVGIKTTGTVHYISWLVDGLTRSFPVTVRITNPLDDKGFPILRAGMSGTIRIPRPALSGIFVPFDAVMKGLDGKHFVFVNEQGRAKVRQITAGPIVSGFIQVNAGLSENDIIIVKGQQFLKNGTLLDVRVADKSQQPQGSNSSDPSAGKMHPSGVKSQSSGEKSHPTGVKSNPPAEKSHPSGAKINPSAEKSYPSGAKSNPSAEKSYPSSGKSYPPAEKSYPSSGKSYPPAEKSYPSSGKSYPSAEKSYPSSGKSYPPAEKSHPTSVKSNPPAGKSYPSEKKSVTSGSKSK